MTVLHVVALGAAFLFIAKAFAWCVQRVRGNAGIVDGVWAWALGLLAVGFAWAGTAPEPVRVLVAVMGLAWGARLGTYLWRRNWASAEDWRYAQFRAEWGPQAQFKMFWFFQFQNLFTLGLAGSAFLPAAYREGLPPTWAMVLAVVIWLVAVLGEGLADAQLKAFKADPKRRGQVCDVGLWRHSRHPNYFFECVHWLAYVPLAWGSPLWVFSLIAPVVMWLLITKMSGVPLLEREMAQRKPGYAEYMRRTNQLVPGPVKA
ncbi:MAG: hypothetical protein RLZZ182_1695 [Pseudomonadota bacterium]|jgi:steroid 5-alpha reductase family enzyme